jgi:phosphoribosylformylglycinamidine cyclo-ligase
MPKKSSYKNSGVDIDAGNRLVELIKPLARSTADENVLGKLGGFSGAYSLPKGKYKNPVLVSAADGVGTKLNIAIALGKLDTVGIDLVAMNVNDIITCGAEPLFFLDYLATSKLVPTQAAEIIRGIAKGCKMAGCVLLGGETAEMPGFYKKDDFDLAGFVVGVVDKNKVIDGSKVRSGDAVIGISSSGLHSNGFSLARRVLIGKDKNALNKKHASLKRTLGEELLEPTKIYVKPVKKLKEEFKIKAMAHITGGGLMENIPRVLPVGCAAVLDSSAWPYPPVMDLIQKQGRVDREEMLRTFNCGIGFILVVGKKDAEDIVRRIRRLREKAYIIGHITDKKKGVSTVSII